jgi:hypothetical protein
MTTAALQILPLTTVFDDLSRQMVTSHPNFAATKKSFPRKARKQRVN